MFSNAKYLNFLTQKKNQLIAKIEYALGDDSKKAIVDKIDKYISDTIIVDEITDDAKSKDVAHEASFANLCAALSENTNVNPKTMSAKDFYYLVEYQKDKADRMEKATKK